MLFEYLSLDGTTRKPACAGFVAGVASLQGECRLHVKADVQADVEPIADVEKIQTKAKTERKTETKRDKDIYAGALRAPRAGSPIAFFFRFPFCLR